MADPELPGTRRRRPLAGRRPEGRHGRQVALTVVDSDATLNLRGPAGDRAFLDAVEEAAGVALPVEANRWHGDNARAALWLGPDEWLLLASDGEAAALEQRLRAALGHYERFSAVDLSQHYQTFTLSGPACRDVLAKGCALDLHPRRMSRGACAQSLLAGTRMLLRCLADGTAFELRVRNSYARYTLDWLEDAMAEYRD